MKIAKLLVLSALLLIGGNAKAEVPDGIWTVPEPTGLTFTDMTFDEGGTRFYLYNPVAKMFFASGNEWSTRASIAAFGYEMWFMASAEEDAPEGSYEFWDNCQHPDRKLGDHNMFTDDGGSTWVDHAAQANYSWSVTKVGDSYRIQNVALIADIPDYDGKYLGWKGDYTDTRLYMLAESEGSIDWKVVSADSYTAFIESDAYTAYKNGVDCYTIAQDLKKVLVEAEAIKAQVADQLAIYTNTASTKEELTKAVADVNAAIEKRKAEMVDENYGNATVENPVDVTDKFVKNPHFDNGDCTTGWSGDAFGRGGTVSDGAEHYNKTYNTYQAATGLVPGVYAVGVRGFYRSGNYGGTAENHWFANDEASKYAKLYATIGESTYETPIANVMSGGQAENQNQGDMAVTYKDAEDNEVTVYVPNTMKTGDYFIHSLDQYSTKLLVGVGDAGELTFGVKKSSQIDGDWSFFDDFSLTYYGAGSDAAKLYLDESIKNYSEMTIDEGTIYTESYLTAYNEALKQEISVNSFEEVATAMAGIEEAKSAIDKNISLWKEWQAEVVKAGEYVANPDYESDQLADYVGPLGDYYDMEQEEILAAMALTNEELQAEIDKIENLITELLEAYKTLLKDGDDVTRFIKNPGFDEDKDINSGKAEGWTINRIDGGNVVRGPLGEANQVIMENALGYRNFCFESWHCHDWDVWQEVEDLPKGMYELSVQGYVRCEVAGYTQGNDINPDFPSPVYLYMNSATAQFPSVYAEQIAPEHFLEDGSLPVVEGHSWTGAVSTAPNSMGAASLCFGWDMYKMTAYGLISKKGDKFRIGVRMKADQDWWCIWDNFKLTYREPSYDIVKPALEEAMKTIDTSNAMGSEVYSLAEKVIGDAYAAIENADANEMFDALGAIYEAADAIRASVGKFTELTNANGDLGAALDRAAVASIRTEAEALYGRIQNGIDNHTLETSEIEGLLAEITIMMNRVGIPADMDEASDVNPIECSTVIINPAYVDGNDNGWTGGAAINASACDAEKFNTNYNYYQVIQGLPEGTYQVTVQGYFRLGAAANDYKSFVEDPTAGNNSFLYAVGEGDTCAVAMMRLASQAVPAEELGDGWVWASEENKLTVPNSMTTAGDIFQTFNEATGKNYYADNRVTVKVGADGKLTIGLKKNVTVTDDWTIWTNWQLFYFGKNSALVPDNDPSGIIETGADKPVKVEYFNLGGIQTDAKGFVIKKETMSDGTVKTQTVIK